MQTDNQQTLATKADLQVLRSELEQKIDVKTSELKAELFRWGFAALLAQTAAIAALVRLL